jgi:thiol:disulfide interchange protein DsbD
VLGGVSLFSLAIGMGMPLLLIGLSAGALLPRAGGWMDAVKRFFGVALLAVAIWLISPLLSEVVQMLLWATLLIISAMFLHALEPLAVNAKGLARFWKGVGMISLIAGTALLLGAMGGSRELLQPLSVYQGGGTGAAEAAPHLAFQRVKDVAALEAAVKGANGRAVMLDFYADWCVSCKEMEKFTFTDAKVQAKLKDVLLLQADVTANSDADKALLARFKLFGPPGIVFFDKTGTEAAYRVVGYEPAEKFLDSLNKALP